MRAYLSALFIISFSLISVSVTAQDTSFIRELQHNFSRNLPRIIALHGNTDPGLLTGPTGNGQSAQYNTNLILVPDAYQTLDFSQTNTIRYEMYIPYKNKASRNALFTFLNTQIVTSVPVKPFVTEEVIKEGNRNLRWLLRRGVAENVYQTEIRMFESEKPLGNEIYYLLTIQINNKPQSYKLRPGTDTTKLRLVEPAAMIELLSANLDQNLKPLSMFTQTKDSVEFFPFVQMKSFATQPHTEHIIYNKASWYKDQILYKAYRYFPDSEKEAVDFLASTAQQINAAFANPPAVDRKPSGQAMKYTWQDDKLPFSVILSYYEESSSFPRQVNFTFRSSPEDINRSKFNRAKVSAEKGDPNGWNEMGIAYYNGKLVGKDDKLAAEYFKRSAKAGNKFGMLNHGMMLMNGFGTKQDVKEAIQWYEKAAENNLPRAMYLLGSIYHNGKHISKNIPKAIEYYKIAADSNYTSAIEELAKIFDDENGYQDKKKAMGYYRIMANGGSGFAMAMIGYIHENENNTDSAFYYYDKSLGLEYPMAYGFIGDLRKKQKDFNRAWEAYLAGSKRDNTYCMNKVAAIYQYGEGSISKDRSKAKEWYRRSAALGNAGAKKSLEFMENEEKPVQDEWDQ